MIHAASSTQLRRYRCYCDSQEDLKKTADEDEIVGWNLISLLLLQPMFAWLSCSIFDFATRRFGNKMRVLLREKRCLLSMKKVWLCVIMCDKIKSR